MSLFLEILSTVSLPIIALVALGGLLQRRLALDVASLNRLQLNVVLPAFLVHFLSTGAAPLAAIWPTAWFTSLQLVLLMALGYGAAFILGLRQYGAIIGLATAYANSGFFGMPVAELAFGRDYVLHQSVVVSLHTILVVTLGVWLLGEPGGDVAGRLARAFETPMLPAIVLGLTLKGAQVTLPDVLAVPIELLSRIFTPLALFTLGAQLAETRVADVAKAPLALTVLLKLAAAPALTLVLAHQLGLAADIGDLVTVAAAAPVGVVLTIFALQFKRHGELAAMAVLVSTVVSPLTVTGWVLLVRLPG